MKFISRIFALTLLFSSFVSAASAQYLEWTAGKKVTINFKASDMGEDYLYFKNKYGSSIQLQWAKVTNTLPSAWMVQICDNANCYLNIPEDTKTTNPIVADEKTSFKLTIFGKNHVGSGKVVIYVYHPDQPTKGDTIEFEVNATTGAGIADQETSLIQMYPNPAADFLNIETSVSSIQQVRIFDLAGKEIITSSNPENQHSLFVGMLQPGVYVVNVTLRDGREVKELFLKE